MRPLDGNAAAAVLHEAFGREVTAAPCTCGGCGATAPLGAAEAWLQAAGTVLRCPACGRALIRIVRAADRLWVNASGARALELPAP